MLRVTAPVARTVTSRSTPISWSRISSALWKRSSGRGAVPFSSQRYSESCSANTATSSGLGSVSRNLVWYPLNSKIITASVRATVYTSLATEHPSRGTSGAWKPTVP